MSEQKLHIVSFSTNEYKYNPNFLIKLYLEKNKHLIIKKTPLATIFSTKFPDQEKETKIMFCSILNVSKEYIGIKDVNCYALFIDLESENSKSRFESILNYAMEYFDFSKKLYIFGLLDKSRGKVKIKKEVIMEYVDELYIPYEYKEINIREIKDILDIFTEIFNYSLLHPIRRIKKIIYKEKIKEQSEKYKIKEKKEEIKLFDESGNAFLKVVLVGESGVGKSSIISQYTNGKFNKEIPISNTAQFVAKSVEFPKFNNKKIRFELWDTPGQVKYRSLTKVFYKDANAILLVYDITKKESFEEIIDHWMPEINEFASKDASKLLNINYFYFSIWNYWE